MIKSLLLLLLLLHFAVSAQTLNYAAQLGGTGDDKGFAVAIGPNNEHYFTGHIAAPGDLDLSGPDGSVTTSGGFDMFLTKRGSDGTFIWGFNVGNALYTIGRELTIASNGDIIVIGTFNGTVDLDPGPGVGTVSSSGGSGTFIVRYTDQGQFLWARQFSGQVPGASCTPRSVAVDTNDDIIVTGYFTNSIDFNPGAFPADSVLTYLGTDTDGFVCKLDANGDFIWVRGLQGTAEIWSSTVAIDPSNNVILGGYASFGDVDLDPGLGVVMMNTSPGTRDGWLIKLDPNGDYLWHARLLSDDACEVFAVYNDGLGNVYAGGYFRGTCDIDPGPGVISQTSAGVADGLLLKLSGTDGALMHSAVFAAPSRHEVRDIALAPDGSLFFSGIGGAQEDFDAGPGSVLSPVTIGEFTCQYDTAFNFISLYGTAVGSNSGSDMAVDLDGSVVSTGSFDTNCDVGPTNDLQPFTLLGSYDAYITSVGTVSLSTTAFNEPITKVAPNPGPGMFMLALPDNTERLEVVDADGRLVVQQRTSSSHVMLDLTAQGQGVYLVRMISRTAAQVVRVVIE